ncbi:hypothetical protein ACFQ3N_18670 [Virgibacillus byunsanensis]|uniref:Uncharacterized protein n=1 Tax=Virgibacillus byunsanensis TaxID=570945 RepID=A0ABW3LTN4_9BACI
MIKNSRKSINRAKNRSIGQKIDQEQWETDQEKPIIDQQSGKSINRAKNRSTNLEYLKIMYIKA